MAQVGRRAPLAGALIALRILPQVVADLLHGERPAKASDRVTLHHTAATPVEEGGWTLLVEHPGAEIALGLVGKF
ncbi:MAG TPA: hypothetical protein VKA47_09765 [Solirubrobacterales bacterium]|nr:hypothetical protein [Solirubrobacterales bacterium]